MTDALSFLHKHSVGVLATLSPEGAPRARTVYYAADDSFCIYFITLSGTRKVDDLATHPHAAFTVSDEHAPQTLQLEGTVADITETAVMSDVISRLTKTLMEHGAQFAPLTHLDPGTAKFYKLTPTWARLGDFTDGFGAEKTFTEVSV